MKVLLVALALVCVSCEARHIPTALIGPEPAAACVGRVASVAFANPSMQTIAVVIDDVPLLTLPPGQQSLMIVISANVAHAVLWQSQGRTVCAQTLNLPGCAVQVYAVCPF